MIATKTNSGFKTQIYCALIAIGFAILSSPAFSASFDCTKAISNIEKLICSDEQLSELDSEMAELYFSNFNEITNAKQKNNFKSTQIKWLKEKVNQCHESECIKNEYISRISHFKYLTAISLLKKNETEKAKIIFLELVDTNKDAIWYLLRKYPTSDEEYINYIIKSIKLGDKHIIENELDELFYRASHLNTSNPVRAYKLFSTLKKLNMTSKVYREKETFSTLSKCYETADFDPVQFTKTYNINPSTGSWELAEDAANNNKFGNPDPKIILALVCRGGFVPRELDLAVEDAYKFWKENKILRFNTCDYAISSATRSYCSTKK